MKQINKILILFIVILFTVFLVFWEALQSKWVAGHVSHAVTKLVRQHLDADIRFDNLQFNFYPPGAELKNVKFKMKRKDLSAQTNFHKIGVYFNPLDLFNTKFQADQIVFEDGDFELDGEKLFIPNKNESKESGKTASKRVNFSFLENIPVKQVRFVRADLRIADYLIVTNKLYITNLRKSAKVEGNLYSPDLYKLLNNKLEVDSLDFSFLINEEKIDVEHIAINSGLISIRGKGEVENYLKKNISYKLDAKVNFPIRQVHEFIEFKKIGELFRGDAKTRVVFKGTNSKFQAEVSGEIKSLMSSFVYGDKAVFKAVANNERIELKEFSLKDGDGSLKLKNSFELFNFRTKTYVNDPIVVDVKNMESENFLYYLKRNVGDLLRTNLTGRARFNLYSRDRYEFSIDKGAEIRNLQLKAGEGKLFEVKTGKIEKGEYKILKNKFLFETDVKTENSFLDVEGEIEKGRMLITMNNGEVDLEEISPIVDLEFRGRGKVGFRLSQEVGEELEMVMVSDFKDFSFQGHLLDRVRTQMSFDFSRNFLNINKLIAESGKGSIEASLDLNYKTLEVDGEFVAQRLNIKESKKILYPILKDFALTSKEINGNWDVTGKVLGKVTPDKIIIKGKAKGQNLYLYDEVLDRFKLNYNLENSSIEVRDIIAHKAKGVVTGDVNYNILSDVLNYRFNASNLPLSEISYYGKIPIKLRSKIHGVFSGVKSSTQHNMNADFRLKDSYVLNTRYQDSSIKFKKSRDDSKVSVSLFGRKVLLTGNLNLSDASNEKSNLKLRLNIPELKKIVSVFSGTNLTNSEFKGKMVYELESQFDFFKQEIFKIKSNMKIFELNKSPVRVKYYDDDAEIIVDSGSIKKWNMNIRGKKFYVISRGSGEFGEKYNLMTRLRLDASLLEVFNDIVTKANGNIRAKIHNFKTESIEDYTAHLTSSNLSLVTALLPTGITKGDIRLSLKNKTLSVEKFIAQLVNGSLSLNGSVNLGQVVPELDLRYVFKDAGISVLKKSNLVFSGKGSIVGKTFPYTVGGDFYVQKFVIVNEISDFSGGDGGFLKKEIDYLPGNRSQISDQIVNFNINVSTRDPIFIANSIADVGFTGTVQLLGGEKDPRLAGKLSLAPRTNRITFKNNEFSLTKGNIFFFERNSYTDPEFDFLAASTINDYRVYVKVLGPLSNFDLGLSSEPSLSQGDVLSLIAFGYTEDISHELSDAEKESMTKAGVGSILFDSFKINETLKNEFGLQINLGTEISEGEGSYLAKRNSDGSTNVGKVRSATTFEVKKQLTEAMTVTVSSTVGSNSSQKQSMNLNYTVDEKVSLEGVYESKTAEDTINNNTSVGADIKWKWSFK